MTALGAVGEGLVELAVAPGDDSVGLGFGGDAGNVCVMAARLGAPSRIAGRVGTDPLGERLLAFWAANGVDTTAVKRDASAVTGLYVNEAVSGGEHRFTYWRRGSAGSRVEPADLPARFFDGLAYLVVTGVTLTVSESSARAAAYAVAEARAAGARIATVVNHRPGLGGDARDIADLAARSDVVVASRDDAAKVFGTADPEGIAAVLGPDVAELVVTDGARAVTVADASGVSRQPVPVVPARNAAGAGDALAGAYLASRMDGRSVTESIAAGVGAAVASVQRDGCAASYPTRDETLALMRRLPPLETVGQAR